jgi:molybdopterin converting factor small subunit
MRVTVKLFATLQKGRAGEEALELSPSTTVGQAMSAIGIPEDQVTLIFLNGRHAKTGEELSDGDTLALFPPVGGG